MHYVDDPLGNMLLNFIIGGVIGWAISMVIIKLAMSRWNRNRLYWNYVLFLVRIARAHKPEGVHLIREDNELIPVELRFHSFERQRDLATGKVKVGANWVIIPPFTSGLGHTFKGLHVNVLPPLTGVSVDKRLVPGLPGKGMLIGDNGETEIVE